MTTEERARCMVGKGEAEILALLRTAEAEAHEEGFQLGRDIGEADGCEGCRSLDEEVRIAEDAAYDRAADIVMWSGHGPSSLAMDIRGLKSSGVGSPEWLV